MKTFPVCERVQEQEEATESTFGMHLHFQKMAQFWHLHWVTMSASPTLQIWSSVLLHLAVRTDLASDERLLAAMRSARSLVSVCFFTALERNYTICVFKKTQECAEHGRGGGRNTLAESDILKAYERLKKYIYVENNTPLLKRRKLPKWYFSVALSPPKSSPQNP